MQNNRVVPPVFKLERFFARYEFSIEYILCSSDAEAVQMSDLLEKADDECRSMWDNLTLSYTESSGHPLLREEISKLYPAITKDDVLTVVPQEGIYIAMKAFMDFFINYDQLPTHKPHVIATFPGYQSLYGNLESDGADVSYWKPQYNQTSGWYFDTDDLSQLIQPTTKLIVVNFPHNPTGWVPSSQQWHQLINLCKDKGILLFSDEMYRLSNNDNCDALPSACSLYENAVTLCGLSKVFALPGLRVGWLCTQNKALMHSFEKFKDWVTICMSAPSEILAIIALRNNKWLVDRTMRIVHSNLNELDKVFGKYPDLVEWHRPPASTVSFMKLKPKLLQTCDGSVSKWCEKLAQDAGVLLVPASEFEYDGPFVRVGFGRKNLKQALAILEKYINE